MPAPAVAEREAQADRGAVEVRRVVGVGGAVVVVAVHGHVVAIHRPLVIGAVGVRVPFAVVGPGGAAAEQQPRRGEAHQYLPRSHCDSSCVGGDGTTTRFSSFWMVLTTLPSPACEVAIWKARKRC